MANNLRFDLTGLAKVCVGLVAASLLADLVSVAIAFSADGGFQAAFGADQTGYGSPFDYAHDAIGLVMIIVVSIWIYRASWNASQLQPLQDRISPGWAIGWFFIPIMNLWKPYQAMRQCWNSSTDPTARIDRPVPGFVALWWWSWLGTFMLPMLGGAFAGATGNLEGANTFAILVLMAVVSSTVSSILFIRLIQSITKAQREASPGLAAVFA